MSANTNSIQQLYVAYFGRPADKTGLAYWETQVALAGGSTTAVSAAFAASAEYTPTFAGLSNDQIVNTIYNNLFHRSPEPDGLTFWSNLLTGGKINISNVVTQIAAGAQGTDSVALAQKVAASVAFTAGLDTTDKILSYNGSAAVTIAKGWLAGIYDVATETAAVLPAALNATIASLPAGGTPGTTYTLTTGIDSFTGTSGDDTFSAADSAAAATWTALDKIDGAGGSNTLSVATALTDGITFPVGATITNIQKATLAASGGIINLDTTTGWSGLTTLTTSESSATSTTLTVAATTDVTSTVVAGGATINGGKNVSVTAAGGDVAIGGGAAATNPVGTVTVVETAAASKTITVKGGTAVTVTETGASYGAVTTDRIIIGTGTAIDQPTGAVVVNATTGTTHALGIGRITVNGGTTVSVTENAGNAAGDTTVVLMGNVVVNGGASTTSVTVNQAKQANSVLAVTAVAGQAAVTAVTAAPGTSAVAGVDAITAVTAVTGVVGVGANGAVTIVDSKHATTTTASNTITSVTLSNYGAATITDNALSTLSLTGKGGTVTITNVATAPTNTTLNLTLNGTSSAVAASTSTLGNTIIDTNKEITTLNVITTGAASSIASVVKTGTGLSAAYTPSGVTKLNVSGDQVFTLQTVAGLDNLTSIAVTGAAGFNDAQHHVSDLTTGSYSSYGVSALAATAPTTFAITTASSGAINITLDPTIQTFVGSTGKTTVTIGAWQNASKVITGGTGANDVLILDGGGSFSSARNFAGTAAGDGAKITGFEVLGVNNTFFGTVDLAKLSAGFTSIEVGIDGITRSATAATGDAVTGFNNPEYGTDGPTNAFESLSFTNVAANTALTFDKGSAGTTLYQLAASGASTKAVTVNLGGATTANASFGTIQVQGANGATYDGIGTVSLVSNGVNFSNDSSTANVNTVVSLVDAGLATLNVSGAKGLVVAAANPNTSELSINNSNTGSAGVTVTTLTDNALGSLTFTGTGKTVVGTLVDSLPSITLTQTGTGTAKVLALSNSTLTGLTLLGDVQLGTGKVGDADGLTVSGSTFTLTGGTDNAHVALHSTATTATVTLGNGNNAISALGTGVQTISLGNGSNSVTTGAGVDVITVGTGANLITGAAGRDDITLGTHTVANNIIYTDATTSVGATGANVDVLHNFISGVDHIQLNGSVLNGLTLTATSSLATVKAAITDTLAVANIAGVETQLVTSLSDVVNHEFAASTAAAGGLVAREVIFTSGAAAGTYLVINDSVAGFSATNDLVIQLVGTTTVAAGDVIGHA